MNNENTNERGDIEHTNTQSAGANGQSSGDAVGGISADGERVEEETKREGLHTSAGEADGQDANAALIWGFAESWNVGLEDAPQRVLEVRDHLWASELYAAPIDVYLKMRATPVSNPPNARSLRKFEAAHLVEWIVGMVLKRAGILQGTELRAEHQYNGLLKVTGRMDKLAGGKPDFEKVKADLEALEIPEGFIRSAEHIVNTLQKKYPNGLANKPIEIKSVSSFAMDAMERKNISIKRHRVQLYHYLISGGYPWGLLVYICRDDNRMAEFHVSLNSKVKDEYKERIELLTKFHRETTPPPKEPLLVWDEDFGKFSKNFNVEYSSYLTMLYGFEAPRDYSEIWGKKAVSWNRTLTRLAKGDKITPLNLTVLEEMRANGYEPEVLAKSIPLDAPEEEVTKE